jgi:pyruvate dehydrogenase E1 component alpha subunit
MLLESLNLAAAWSLPVLFVCKDNGWAVVTRSATVTGGDLTSRARAFGLTARDVDGTDPVAVYDVVGGLLAKVREGAGPAFLHARVSRLDGHYLGDALVDMARHPTHGTGTTKALLRGLLEPDGASASSRARSLGRMLGLMIKAREEAKGRRSDPLVRERRALMKSDRESVESIEAEETGAVERALHALMEEVAHADG